MIDDGLVVPAEVIVVQATEEEEENDWFLSSYNSVQLYTIGIATTWNYGITSG